MKRNRTLLGVVCIALGILVCFCLLPFFNRILSGKATILRAKADIPRGIIIKEEMLESVSVGNYNLPKDVILSDKRSDVIGKYSTVKMCKGDYILPQKIKAELVDAEHVISSLTGERWAISVNINQLASSVSAKIESGDIVSVISTKSKEEKGEIYPQLQYVEVISTTNEDTVDVSEVGKKEENNTPVTVTLLANKAQAEILAKLSADNSAHLAIVCRKDNEDLKKSLLQAQADIINNVAMQNQ